MDLPVTNKKYGQNAPKPLIQVYFLSILTMDGVRIVHLGDLGQLLTPDQLAEVGHVDIV